MCRNLRKYFEYMAPEVRRETFCWWQKIIQLSWHKLGQFESVQVYALLFGRRAQLSGAWPVSVGKPFYFRRYIT